MSEWRSDGTWDGGNGGKYAKEDKRNVSERKGPYLDLEGGAYMFSYTDVEGKKSTIQLGKATAVQLKSLFANVRPLNEATYVLCDSFEKKNPVYAGRVGMPILYFRADNAREKAKANRTYNFKDNETLINCGVPWDDAKSHELDSNRFYSSQYIGDRTKVLPSFYLLITAGPDGLYGTDDDIVWRSNQQYKLDGGEVIMLP
jgi:hypothetical protein